jgi:Ca2+-binding RTX toxin-like protein
VENLTLYALSSLDTMYGTGNELSNEIRGDYSLDTLIGKAGNDILMSGAGNDTLIGGKGSDTLTGGTGADRFLRKYSTTAIDTITDFQVGEDLLGFSASGFGGGLAGGAVLNETQFTIGSAAADSSDRFIYNSATGGLFFDADGIGGTAQVKIFTLSSGLAMTNADIFIFA